MDFNGIKCPVCDVEFKDGDDIVVCPECGTPHHRACYEQENHCFYEDQHSEGFEYGSHSEAKSDVMLCPRCGSENPKDSFYCSKCGCPLNFTAQQNTYQNTGQTASPFGFQSAFDPMGGVNPEEDMGDGVTAGELSKFVGTSTPYFMRVFSRIKVFARSKFSLAGFLLGGWYLLYRKMYKLGAALTSVSLLLMIVETYIQYSPAYNELLTATQNASGATGYFAAYTNAFVAFNSISEGSRNLLIIMGLCTILRIVMQVVIGINANRWYFNHCRSSVRKIKETESNPSQAIESKGGVNAALAISMLAIYVAINYVPMFIFGY